jgi:hypothetical protein
VLLSHKPLPPQLQISRPVTDFLWSTVKDNVYSIKPASLHTVKACIMATIHNIPAATWSAALIVNPKQAQWKLHTLVRTPKEKTLLCSIGKRIMLEFYQTHWSCE